MYKKLESSDTEIWRNKEFCGRFHWLPKGGKNTSMMGKMFKHRWSGFG